MRDPKRIERITALLAQVWRMYPDTRLGQLIENIHDKKGPVIDIWHTEDDKWEELIRNWLTGRPSK